MKKQTKENIQLYFLTAALFGCFSLPFISFFKGLKHPDANNKNIITPKEINDSIKADSIRCYKYSFEKQRQ